jgi:hypothetical protein
VAVALAGLAAVGVVLALVHVRAGRAQSAPGHGAQVQGAQVQGAQVQGVLD